ncbi:MAG: hypothetical protein ACJ72N_27490 [Labedaea sp.]
MLITSPDPYRLRELVRRERARHAIVVIREMEMVAPGVWGVAVYQVRRPRPVWLAPAAWAGGTLAVAAAGCLLVQALVGFLAGLGLATVVGALAVGLLLARMTRGRGCETTVRVTHRH